MTVEVSGLPRHVRANVELTYYSKLTKDALINAIQPPSAGTGTFPTPGGSVSGNSASSEPRMRLKT